MNGNSIKALFLSVIPEAVTIIRGVVTKQTPLEIIAVGDEKLRITETLLVVPRHLSDYTVECDITLGDGSHTQNTAITIKNALKRGDRVFLLSFNHGKKYYILDRDVENEVQI